MLLDEPPSDLEEDRPEETPPASVVPVPILLEPRGDRAGPLRFRQGGHPPFGIRWYGVTSLFGHLRNFTARLIATESVDSRDWMRPNAPEAILTKSQEMLRGQPAPTLVESLGRPLWLDFVADTADDRDVSAGVGHMLASTYEIDGRHLPRGDVLLFGGDIAYPVATADEIYKRLVAPWNEQLRKVAASQTKRVLLGVPGNHDWYDGLDGFGRLFRRPMEEPFRSDRDTSSRLGKQLRKRKGRKLGVALRQLQLDEVGGIYSAVKAFFRSVKAFFGGVAIRRRRRLVLRGYLPVQEASYFVLPLAPGLDLFGADRQLGRVDFRQRAFFTRWRKKHPDRAVLFTAGDPALAYGMVNAPGAHMLKACRLSMERDRVLYIAGDFHHYERRSVKDSLHVIAGGGGAFLHGTRIAPYPEKVGPPAVAYPDAAESRKLAVQVPVRLMFGRAGFLVHLALGLLALIQVTANHGPYSNISTAVVISTMLSLLLYFIAHEGDAKKQIASLAIPFGCVIGCVPMALTFAVPKLPGALIAFASNGALVVVSAFLSSFVFGIYLTLLCIFGFEHQQAFTVLGHPGFKHFMRLCIHEDGRVEAWTIGKDDVLAEGPPLLIDRFEWKARP